MKRRLAENLKRVQGRIESACARAKRDPAELTLVVVTKTVGIDVIKQLADTDTKHLGESRVQELTKRAAVIHEYLSRRQLDPAAAATSRPRWHMIGHLQRNKVKALLPWVDLIHSVDSLRLAEEIAEQAEKLGRTADILLEVNAGLEPQKYGVPVAAAFHLAEQIRSLPSLRLSGLMTMAPFDANLDRAQQCFARTRELFDEIRHDLMRSDDFCRLSMGMSHDFETAIECGATMLRIGSALFEGVATLPNDAEDGPDPRPQDQV